MPLGPALLRTTGVPTGDLSVVAATAYTDGGRRLLLAFKEGGRHELGEPVADLLARAVLVAVLREADPSAPMRLVPVPSRPRTRRARGADLGLVVARLAAAGLRRAGWDARAVPLLRHRSSSRDQAGLNRRGRLRNVSGTLMARGRPRPADAAAPAERWLVVDDIVTTGATLREAARALLMAGFPVAGAAVVAATQIGTPAAPLRVGTLPLSTARGGV